MSTRYVDEGYPLLHWATEIEAICPQCGGVGIIHGNPHWKDWHATFMCQKCSHSMKTKRDPWHGPVLGVGKKPCGSCGYKWVRLEKKFDDIASVKKESTSAPCPHCNADNVVPLKFTRTEPADHAIDPFLGLRLALIENTRHGVVWVYGADHLDHLKRYISAQLREGTISKWSYFSRLPTWIKAAKNREMVLKAIKKLEARLITKGCAQTEE